MNTELRGPLGIGLQAFHKLLVKRLVDEAGAFAEFYVEPNCSNAIFV